MGKQTQTVLLARLIVEDIKRLQEAKPFGMERLSRDPTAKALYLRHLARRGQDIHWFRKDEMERLLVRELLPRIQWSLSHANREDQRRREAKYPSHYVDKWVGKNAPVPSGWDTDGRTAYKVKSGRDGGGFYVELNVLSYWGVYSPRASAHLGVRIRIYPNKATLTCVTRTKQTSVETAFDYGVTSQDQPERAVVELLKNKLYRGIWGKKIAHCFRRSIAKSQVGR